MTEAANKNYEIISRANKACGWFAAIAIFSLINSVLIFFKSNMIFVIGLGITMIVDGFISGIRQEITGAGATIVTVIGIIINLILIGIFFLIWHLSKRGSKTVYIIGMVLYLLDGLIFLLFQDWMGLAFHGFFLYMLIAGYNAINQRASAEKAISAQTIIEPTASE